MKGSQSGLLGLCLSSLCGCAAGPVIIDGQPMQRLTQTFVGQPFHVTHTGAHPRPGSPSSGVKGDGGEIAGLVCGASVNLSVTHARDHVSLSGMIDGQHLMELEIREVNGYHRITGNMAYHTVDLGLFGDRLMGWVGHCKVDMRPEDTAANQFVQFVNIRGNQHKLALDGINELWAMPAADQAATLPLLLHCQISQMFNFFGSAPPAVGYGGKEGALPAGTMSFLSKNTQCR